MFTHVYLNTVQIAQIQAHNFECTPCSDAISGPMNRVFDFKSGHDFCWYRNSIQVIYFQINEDDVECKLIFEKQKCTYEWHMHAQLFCACFLNFQDKPLGTLTIYLKNNDIL